MLVAGCCLGSLAGLGDEALEQIMTEGVKAWWLPNLEKLPDGPEALPQRVKMFVAGLRGHLQPLHIEEDEEKVVIQMQPWRGQWIVAGAGGRLFFGEFEVGEVTGEVLELLHQLSRRMPGQYAPVQVDSYLRRERESSKFSFEDILSEELRLDRDEGDRPAKAKGTLEK